MGCFVTGDIRQLVDKPARPPARPPCRIGVNRIQFLLQSLVDLDGSLRARGSRLLVLQGSPEEVLPRVIKSWGATTLCFEHDTEPYAIKRDATITTLVAGLGVDARTHVSHTLYDIDELLCRNKGKTPLTMTAFQKVADAAGDPPPPAPDPPEKLPGPAVGAKFCGAGDSTVPSLVDVGSTDIPTAPFAGGESVALARLATFLADKDWVASFEKPKGNPAALEPPATTILSPYLKFGCLSPRLFHSRLLHVYKEKKGKHTQPPVSLRGQLLWREFFYTCGVGIPNFDRMVGNPICRQIPWVDDPGRLRAWEEGRTGYPW
jgi:cryptochrome